MQTVGLVTTLSEMRDPYTAGHEWRVAEIAVAIGKALDLNELQLEGLKVGGYLHDVGKTSVPVEIFTKPGKINNLEYELIKIHSRAGYEILKDVDFPWPVAQIALQHHELIDGSGYP
jgi:putative nucleotidyltransferase with HDIG domain